MAALSRIGLIAKTGDPRARAVLLRVAAALDARGATVALESATAADAGLAHPAHALDTLAARSGLSAEALAALLTEWELAGVIEALPGGRYQRLR